MTCSEERIPTLRKREYDDRLMAVDVSGNLREGASVVEFLQVIARNDDGFGDALELNVAISSKPIAGGRTLLFRCSGGTATAEYIVAVRYRTTHDERIESIVRVHVV